MKRLQKVVIDTSALLNNEVLINSLKDNYKIIIPINFTQQNI